MYATVTASHRYLWELKEVIIDNEETNKNKDIKIHYLI